MKLCGKENHKNIVSVLKWGELPNSAYYFIDMELCDLNLAVYIHRTDAPSPSESLPYFIKDASSELRALQIWNIMRQIAGGIKYIHSHDLVHRDVKPANGISYPEGPDECVVLYSRKDSAWKLADFGITSDGTARRCRRTTGGRGTPGYRAPELVSDANAVYNNKVDIWAMGCILHELAMGTKLFSSDWGVIQHQLAGKDLEINLDEVFGEECGGEIKRNIILMLQLDPQSRPSATGLFETFSRLGRSLEGLPPDEGEVETLEDTYAGLSLHVTGAEATLHKREERRRIDKIIKVWKDANIDILAKRDDSELTAIHEAAKEGDLDKIKALKKLGADLSPKTKTGGWTPIHYAAQLGHVDAIKVLKQLGADLSPKLDDGWTPMHIAASNGKVDVIKALRELGADLSPKLDGGSTPMHIAAQFGQVDAIKELKELGADLLPKADGGWTPMHIAASNGKVDAIKALKELGADLSPKEDGGSTPMHTAARYGQVDAIKALKELGADVSTRDNAGRTPYYLAYRARETLACDVLKTLGSPELSFVDRIKATFTG